MPKVNLENKYKRNPTNPSKNWKELPRNGTLFLQWIQRDGDIQLLLMETIYILLGVTEGRNWQVWKDIMRTPTIGNLFLLSNPADMDTLL